MDSLQMDQYYVSKCTPTRTRVLLKVLILILEYAYSKLTHSVLILVLVLIKFGSTRNHTRLRYAVLGPKPIF